MARFPKAEAEIAALAQAMVSGLAYRIIAVNKAGDGEPSNTAMVLL